ncbi:hypothetical protein SAMN06295909_1397 [Plantibacter sp. VKM Ac-1784]|uniref:Extensin-like C-terminal domain-containing protein n=1 Tax=Plantibacter elymi (nom. nud.) TaxID=199708 RepID=A0ABY1RDE9_9MICO|nr:hypothetical protein [Plantibacter sp. VKM Ac-1784]SMQ66991.1 hypothetical protein SAMN06295909_1397 [Plantibacter sp. VKM Ac-1784]
MAAPMLAVKVVLAIGPKKLLGGALALMLGGLVATAALPAIAITLFVPAGSALRQAHCAAPGAVPAGQPTGPLLVAEQLLVSAIVDAAAAITPEPKAKLAALTAAYAASNMTASTSDTITDDTPLGVYRRTVRGGWGTTEQLQDTATATALILTGAGENRPGIMSDPAWIDEPAGWWLSTIGIHAETPTIASAEASARNALAVVEPELTDEQLTVGAACNYLPIDGDNRELALRLVSAMDGGRLVGSDYLQQLRNVANGTALTDCGIDSRIMQILLVALNTFEQVAVSDLNRRCTGSLEGAGENSSHYRDGGGMAVDIYALNGSSVTGGDGLSLQLLALLDSVVPPGSRTGQSNCRNSPGFTHFDEFEDTCNHVHIDVAYANPGL